MRKEEVSKSLLIVEEVFYVFMFIYGALFLVAFTLSAFKQNIVFGIVIGLVCGLFAGIFLYFILFRLRLICTKEVIYEDDLKFMGYFFGVKKKSKDRVPVEGVISVDEFKRLDKDNDGEILVSEFYPLTEEEVEKKILEVDENFSKTVFTGMVNHIYRMYENSFNKLDSLIVRAFMSDTLYFQHRLLINELSNKDYKEKRSNIRIKGLLLKDFKVEGNKEILTVALTSKMIKYCVDDVGYVVSGSKEEYIDVPYVMTFIRNVGVKTDSDSNLENCPNCGAGTKVNDDGICDYCNTYVVSGDYGWVLTDIKVIDII